MIGSTSMLRAASRARRAAKTGQNFSTTLTQAVRREAWAATPGTRADARHPDQVTQVGDELRRPVLEGVENPGALGQGLMRRLRRTAMLPLTIQAAMTIAMPMSQ